MPIPSLHSAKPDPDQVEHGCGFMREMLSSLADGTLKGVMRWYAEHHVAGCPHCSAALVGLRELRTRLREFGLPAVVPDEPIDVPVAKEGGSLRLLSPERRAAITAAWEKMDQETPTV